MKEFPFKQSFSCQLKPLVSEEKDKFLAMASLIEIGKFIPNINTVQNIDLLPIAFNACVANRVNKNGDVIDTQTAITIYSNFIHKPINVEHNRQKVLGTILVAGFSEFGTDKPLSIEEVKNLTSPFNITLGGIIWRLVNPEIVDIIEESNDPTSDNYLKISASWELGFSEFNIVTINGHSRNLTDGRIITEESQIEELKNNLKALGGDGKVDDVHYYRMPINDVIPLGIGLTEKPAAEVKGIVVPPDKEVTEGKQKIISQNEKINVKERRQNTMKITSVQDITDETLKESKASDVADFIATELKKGSEVWEKEKVSLNNALAETKTAQEKVLAENTKLTEDIKNIQATLKVLSDEKIAREKVDKFNARMTEINEQFELDDEVRAAIVDDVKSLASDEDFDKWKKKAQVLLKGFAKKAKKEDKEDKEEQEEENMHKKEKECKANDETVENALENAKKEANKMPNSSSSNDPTLKDKYQAAFAKDNFIIKV